RVRPALLAGSALLAGQQTALTAGQAYTWFDHLPTGAPAAQYWLEDVDLNGARTMHGPVVPVAGTVDRHSSAQARATLLRELSASPATQQQTGWAGSWQEQQARLSAPASFDDETAQTQFEVAAKPGVKLRVRK